MRSALFLLFFVTLTAFQGQEKRLQIARLKYSGGGDWYVSPSSLPNLLQFCNEQLNTKLATEESVVEPGSPELFNYPFIHMTGHGNVFFSDAEAKNLRNYLIAGGFLNINDSYGMAAFAKREMKKVFPELEFTELPFSHPIYHQRFDFQQGLPKIHEHDNKPPQGLGLSYKGRLVCFLNVESDIGDGWENPDVHHDPQEKRLKALQMGANIVQYVFSN